jgi:hypothetical protein
LKPTILKKEGNKKMKKMIMVGMIALVAAVHATETFEFVTSRKDGTNTVTVINTIELDRCGISAIASNEKTVDMLVHRHTMGMGARMFGGGSALDRIIKRRNRLNLPTLEEIQKVENCDVKQTLLTQWVTLTSEEEIEKAEALLKEKKEAAAKAKKEAEELLKKKAEEAKALKEAKAKTETKK